MADLKLSNQGNPYTFISEMKIITETFKKLGIIVDNILQYFFWHAMPDKVRQQFVAITNVCKPSLQQILYRVFDATERYMVKGNGSEVQRNVKESTAGLAVNVNYQVYHGALLSGGKFRPCVLCSVNGDCHAGTDSSAIS